MDVVSSPWVRKERSVNLIGDFKAFLLRGNVIDLAVAVVIGAAFGAVVTSLVEDMLTPLLAAIFGEPDFSALTFSINDSVFRYGSFINAVIAFTMIAAAVFFAVVVPVNAFIARSRKEPPPDPTVKKCPRCMNDIPVDATKCGFCTVDL